MMQAGEIGVAITKTLSSKGDITSFTGATAVVLRVKNPQTGATSDLAMVPNGSTATYITTASDFPVPGLWQIQLIVTFSATEVYKDAVQILEVGESL